MLDQRVNEAIRVLWMSTEYDRSNDIKKMLEEAAAEKDGDACLLLSRCYGGACFIPEKFNFEEDNVKCEEYLDMSIRYGSALGMFAARRLAGYTPPNNTFIHEPYHSNHEIWDAVLSLAKENEPFSQYLIANAYYYGDCIELMDMDEEVLSTPRGIVILNQFMDEAEIWFEACIRQGFRLAIGNYVDLLTSGDYGREINKEKAWEMKIIGADYGYEEYQALVGDYLALKDPEKAKEYLDAALAQGNKEALFGYGMIYGIEGKNPDLVKSNKYFEEGLQANAWSVSCKNRLAQNYFHGGYGIEADPAKAFSYVADLEDSNDWASDIRGICYLHGWGVAPNYEKAKQQLEIYSGDKVNAIGLGEIYAYGLGVPVDIAKGMQYWNKFPDDPKVIEHKKNFKKGLFGWKRISK